MPRKRYCGILKCENWYGTDSVKRFFRYVRLQFLGCHSNCKTATKLYFSLLYRIPTTAEHREKWLEAIEIHQPTHQIKEGFHICELHSSAQKIFYMQGRSRTHDFPSRALSQTKENVSVF